VYVSGNDDQASPHRGGRCLQIFSEGQLIGTWIVVHADAILYICHRRMMEGEDQQTVVTVLSGRYNQFNLNPPERMLLDYVIPALPKSVRGRCPA
jgi:hypothetical protein